jgi:hypothetical protein
MDYSLHGYYAWLIMAATFGLPCRDFQIDLAARIGKTQVVGANTPLNQQARSLF